MIETVPDLAPASPTATVNRRFGIAKGLLLTFLLAAAAGQLARLPYFSVLGVMLLSLLLGMAWSTLFRVPADAQAGVAFSSKTLLRTGIILMGLRLHIGQIVQAGLPVLAADALVIAFTLAFMLFLGRRLGLDAKLSALLAAGTAVCGAAAIVAVAPFIGAKKSYTAVSVAYIALLGTAGTIGYLLLAPQLGQDSYAYGLWAGLTLQELGHVIAASQTDPAAADIAIVVKLGRVALLVPVVLVLGYLLNRPTRTTTGGSGATEASDAPGARRLPFPWFVVGFLLMCLIHSLDVIPSAVTARMIDASVLLLSAAMAGIGLGIRFSDFRNVGLRAVLTGLIGFLALAVFGQALLHLLPGLLAGS